MDLAVRPARWEDAQLLWRWANDPVVRANAFRPEAIPLEAHLAWFRGKLAAAGTRIYIVEHGGVPAAQVRYDADGDKEALIDVSVAPEHRGRGLGAEALRRTAPRACQELGVAAVVGVVLEANAASRAAFRAAGFAEAARRVEQGRPCVVFRWPPP